MKYLKYFKTKEEYEAFKASGEYLTPNVSFIETAGSVINDSYQISNDSTSTMEYFRAEDIANLADFASWFKLYNESMNKMFIVPACIYGMSLYNASTLIAVGLDFQLELFSPEPFNGKLIDALMKVGNSEDQLAAIPRITKEEFYNLDVTI